MALVTFSTLRLGALGAALLMPLPAAAQTTTAQKATAEAYFDDALRLMKTASYAEACTKLEASQRLEPAVGTLLYLGECYEKRGRTASAWVTFRDAEALARSLAQPQRAEMARVHAERLQAGLSRITVEISSEARATSGLQVRCGSVPLDPALPSVPLPVDPGEVVVEATAPGYLPYSRSVNVAAGAKLTATIPALARQAAASATPTTPATASPATAPPQSVAPVEVAEPFSGAFPSPLPAREPPPSLVLPVTLGAIGLVGLGVGGVFGLKSISNASEARDLCPNGACSEARGETLMDSARHQAQISNVAFAVGAVGLAAGVIVFVLGRPKKVEQAVAVSPWLSPAQAGLALSGRL
jgi:serine/threonine-protein kinase